MKYQLLAAGALAPLAAAVNINRRDWDNHVQYVTNVEVVTVYDVVTVYADGSAPAATPDAASGAGSSSGTASVEKPSATAAAVPSSVEAVSSSVDASPSSVAGSIVGGGPITLGSPIIDSSSSSSAAAPSTSETAAVSSAIDSSSAAAPSTSAAVLANTLVDSHSRKVQTTSSDKPSTLTTHVVASSSGTQAQVQATSAVPKAQSTQSSSSSSSSSSGRNITTSHLSPRGKKAGLSGYVGIQQLDAFTDLAPYISWYSDYTANTTSVGNVVGVGMLWAAAGSTCGASVTNRVAGFDNLVSHTTPEIMFGFYEPDCYCPDSSAMTTAQGQAAWNKKIAPLKAKGTVLGSPSMCKQRDEDWLTPFKKDIDADWDVTSVHINVPDLDGIKKDIEYYASTYGKPIWVSEFACVYSHDGWNPCTDQAQVNQFIKDAVHFFQNNDTVVAYGPSNGNGLGDTWPLTTVSGALSESGKTYLNALKSL